MNTLRRKRTPRIQKRDFSVANDRAGGRSLICRRIEGNDRARSAMCVDAASRRTANNAGKTRVNGAFCVAVPETRRSGADVDRRQQAPVQRVEKSPRVLFGFACVASQASERCATRGDALPLKLPPIAPGARRGLCRCVALNSTACAGLLTNSDLPAVAFQRLASSRKRLPTPCASARTPGARRVQESGACLMVMPETAAVDLPNWRLQDWRWQVVE
jgi:hypothetical protein